MTSARGVSMVLNDAVRRGEIAKRDRRLVGLQTSGNHKVAIVYPLHASKRHLAALSRVRRHLIQRGYSVNTTYGTGISLGGYHVAYLWVSGSAKPRSRAIPFRLVS